MHAIFLPDLRVWLIAQEADPAGVEALCAHLAAAPDPAQAWHALECALRYFPQFWDAEIVAAGKTAAEHPDRIRSQPAFVLALLRECSVPARSRLYRYAQAQQVRHGGGLPPLPWENPLEQALARLSAAAADSLCTLLQRGGIEDPALSDSLFGIRMGDRYRELLRRLLGDGAIAWLWEIPRGEWRGRFQPWYVRSRSGGPP